MMIAEAVIAMIWAAAAMSMLDGQTSSEFIKTGTPSAVVNEVSNDDCRSCWWNNCRISVHCTYQLHLEIQHSVRHVRLLRTIQNSIKKKLTNRLMIAIPLFVILCICFNAN